MRGQVNETPKKRKQGEIACVVNFSPLLLYLFIYCLHNHGNMLLVSRLIFPPFTHAFCCRKRRAKIAVDDDEMPSDNAEDTAGAEEAADAGARKGKKKIVSKAFISSSDSSGEEYEATGGAREDEDGVGSQGHADKMEQSDSSGEGSASSSENDSEDRYIEC